MRERRSGGGGKTRDSKELHAKKQHCLCHLLEEGTKV